MSIEAKVSRLSLDLKQGRSPKSSSNLKQADETPESWEDEIIDNASPVEAPGPSLKQITSNDSPAPPPPTPVSPQDFGPMSRRWDSSVDTGKPTPRYATSARDNGDRRPEKTIATANRMIAGALGIKAPRKTEEQKQYDKAAKEAEIKRRNREKEQRERDRLEEEKAKAAVWDA